MKRSPFLSASIAALVLSTLALLPAYRDLPVDAPAQTATTAAAAVMERRAGEAGDPRFRARDHRSIDPELRPARGAHRDVRSGRHALGRASHVHASGVLPGSRPGGGGEEARAAGTSSRSRPCSPATARRWPSSRCATSRRFSPRRDRHVGGGIQRRSEEVDRRRPSTRAGTGLTPNWCISRCSRCCDYLRDNGYKTYIVTGGGQDFVRVYAEKVYGIPPEQVVGTAGGTNTATTRTASQS